MTSAARHFHLIPASGVSRGNDAVNQRFGGRIRREFRSGLAYDFRLHSVREFQRKRGATSASFSLAEPCADRSGFRANSDTQFTAIPRLKPFRIPTAKQSNPVRRIARENESYSSVVKPQFCCASAAGFSTRLSPTFRICLSMSTDCANWR